MLQINSLPDPIHIFIGMRPHQAISSLVQNIKTQSSIWIKENKLCKISICLTGGGGAFSYSKSHVPDVIRYIQSRWLSGQEAHHKKETFLDEYRKILKAFEIEYDQRQIFREPE